MAATIAKAFDEFAVSIAPTAATTALVGERKDNVTAALKAAFPSSSNVRWVSSRLIGSFGRNTASWPFNDLDLLVHLHVDDELWSCSYILDSSDFLYRVRSSLNNASTVRKVGARGQAVRLFYADGLAVDVAAVVRFTGGGYGIPDGRGGWLTTDPQRHAEYLDGQNASLSGDLKNVVRMAKQWNTAHSTRLSSFHLEMLVARTFGTMGSNSRTALKLFFDYNNDNLSVLDPAGYSGDLSGYLSWGQRNEINQSLAAASDRAQKALDAEDRGDHQEAIRLWRINLGSLFPVYG